MASTVAAVVQSSLQVAAAMEAQASSVAIEQDDPILMEGNPEVWDGESVNSKKDSESVYSMQSSLPSINNDDDS
eukprot:scaffold9181_cov118-Amphora_coffeaeformis.AAC.1